ncbi:MAG: DUF5686 and carboxypeptidase regulatory-like domain-containing protein [Dysgonamonadaceae bacterium]|jgi:hypothetical protein|nr:DUF5686 and carboxypeptidase regulatory-like domain-containing protein [Dysgonamonadaceae bacterium]
MKIRLTLLLILAFPCFISAQMLKGKVVSADGEPVPASVYIRELKQGFFCSAEGEFQVNITQGKYTVEFQCLGYEPQTKTVTIEPNTETTEIAVVLREKAVKLKEVTVYPGKEDPAYRIMRKAIEKAPYYQSIVQKMTYESYCKGSAKITNVAKILKSVNKAEVSVIEDKLFLIESVSEVNFEAPDKYEKEVKAFSSTYPSISDPKSALIPTMISLYRPMWGQIVMPLNPKSFDYYRFRYEGYDEDNGQIISKITIIPKLKDPKLISGVIYIAEDTWDIRRAEIVRFAMGIEQQITYNYNQVADGIYMITNGESHADIGILGNKAYIDFMMSFQYSDIQFNDSLTAIAYSKGKIKPEQPDKKSLEIKRNQNITADSLADKRDSLYWAGVRTVALSEEELQSYARRDSVKVQMDSLENAEKNPKFSFGSLIMGGVFGRDSAAVRVKYSGLIDIFSEYNFVDGVWLGQSFEVDFRRKRNTGFVFSPSIYWASARKELIYKGKLTLDFAPLHFGFLEISGGNTSEDYSGTKGVDRFINADFSLFSGRNPARFYRNKFADISASIEVANGLQIRLGLKAARRSELENHTTWNLFGAKDRWSPNRPDYAGLLNPEYADLAYFGFGVRYIPEVYYMIEDGRKTYVKSRFPIISFSFSQGLNLGDSRFTKAQLGVNQDFKTGIFSSFSYTLIAGKFFNKNPFNYIDYQHFATGGNTWISFKQQENSYALLPFYQYAAKDYWIQAFLNYRTDYLLLKRLPPFQGKIFNENLHYKFLHTAEKPFYSEIGYSIELPAFIDFGAGLFASFDKLNYNGFGIQVSLPLSELQRIVRGR